MMKRVFRGALGVLILVGLVLALWPLGQSVYGHWNQRQLRAQWDKQSKQQNPTSKPKTQNFKTQSPKTQKPSNNPKPKIRNPKPKWPSTRIVIPDANVDAVILDGWDESTLRRAPGHLPGSANPGQIGNCVIAGHRNIYGSPFYQVDQLMAGAPIELQTPDATYTYRVISVFGTTDTDMTVVRLPPEEQSQARLTLITCTIPRTVNRIVVSAQLEEQ